MGGKIMREFDYNLFHKLFGELSLFYSYIAESEKIEGVKVKDGPDDLTGCLHLSIFNKLKKMYKKGDFNWSENVNLFGYKEIKESDEIVGARGIISSNMDWGDAENPRYYYEFAHLETGGQAEEYIRELHIDEIVMNVLSGFGDTAVQFPKGHDESKALIANVFESSKDEFDVKGLKQRCLLEGKQDNGEYFEVWKMGYVNHDKSYLLLVLGPQFLGELNADTVLKAYLHDEKIRAVSSLDWDFAFKKSIICASEGKWYHEGKIELEAEKKAKAKKPKAEKKPEAMDAILNPDGPDRKATKELIDALSTVKGPADKYAKDLIEKIKKGYKIQTGEEF